MRVDCCESRVGLDEGCSTGSVSDLLIASLSREYGAKLSICWPREGVWSEQCNTALRDLYFLAALTL